MSEAIAISGISGRFPQSGNVTEFWENLITGVNMVTEDEVRWKAGFAGVPERKGTLKNDLEHFDSEFFNMNRKQVERLDPQIRQLLEVTFETIMDSGCNPTSLRGANVGVYVGASSHETLEACRAYSDLVSGYDITGSSGCMFSNRISYAFDLRGPSFTIDTYCSSSLMALHTAAAAIRNGECEAAIVAGVNLLLNPIVGLQMQMAGALSPDGKCKAFDASANGYVRSEAIVAVFLQKNSAALRTYATIVHTKANTDGYKENGVSFPSGAVQEDLMRKTYQEAGIDPASVCYVEPHGTGTSVGDPEEVGAIFNVFCPNRNTNNPLLIGSTKSNMGHAEPAASLCAVIKTVLSIQNGVLPGNLHFNHPNPSIPALTSGRMKVVAANMPITGSIFGINATGIGGSNVHCIFKSVKNPTISKPLNNLPILVPFSGRTAEGVSEGLQKMISEFQIDDEDNLNLATLMQKLHVLGIPGLDFRGYGIVDGATGSREVMSSKPVPINSPSLWYVFPGMGTQWAGMAKELLPLEIFRKSLEASSLILNPVTGIDLIDLLTSGSEKDLEKFMSISFLAMAIALLDLLSSINLQPDGIIGHSAGEMLCAYSDGSLTREEALMSFHYKDLSVNKCSGGAMAAVGLTWEQAHARCPAEVFPACHNARDSVTLTGRAKALSEFVAVLKEEGIFAREIPTGGVAYHSPYFKEIAPEYEFNLRKLIKNPKSRSKGWISTSVPESEWPTELTQTVSPEYIVNNFLSPVYFYEALKHIPENAVVLEVSSHSMFQSILRKSLPKSCTSIGMMKRNSGDNLMRVFTAVGKLFELGFNPKISKLYPEVPFPLSRVPFISPLIKWKHTETHPLLDYVNKSRAGQQITEICLANEAYKYLEGHKIDGRVLFPAMGYLVLVWKEYAKTLNQPYERLPVNFQNVSFLRATILSAEHSMKLKIEFFVSSGEFQVLDEDTIVVTGKIQKLETPSSTDLSQYLEITDFDHADLFHDDIYKDFRLRGYEYTGLFKGIHHSNIQGTNSATRWNNNWTAFLDTLVQTQLIGMDSGALKVPTRLRKLTIDPVSFCHLISNNVHQGSQNTFIIPTKYCRNSKIISCHGIEIDDLRPTRIPRRETVILNPSTEEYKFVPYFDTEDVHWDFLTALKIIVEIVLENVLSRELRVEELSPVAEAESLLHAVTQIIQSNPTRTVQPICSEPLNMAIQGGGEADLLVFQQSEDFLEHARNIAPTTFVVLKSNDDRNLDLNETDWNVLALKRTLRGGCLRLLLKKPNSNAQTRCIKISNISFDWLEQVKSAVFENEFVPTYLVDENGGCSGVIGLTKCLRLESGGERIRCIVYPKGYKIDQDQMKSIVESNLVMNVIDQNSVIGSYRHLHTSNPSSSTADASKYAYLNVTTTGDLSSVEWIQAPHSLSAHNDLCKVHYASLNFRDIMLAIGKLSLDALPGNLTSQDCVLGLEFAGTNSGGELVIGAVESRGLATHVVADTNFMWQVPTEWSLEEAVTVPIAYSTAYYALVVRGGIQTGESIFITSGSGGVGQAAIRIALSFNCNIFTSVGSEDKKLYLLETFPELKESQILNSRTTEFESQIMKTTNGKGVNLVLNSLSDDKLQAGIHVLANGGRFLEIGKFDLSNNSALGMSIFLKNVSFHGILLDALFGDENLSQKKAVVQLVSEGIQNGVVKPLPRRVFECNRAEKAFRFMASGKHIGKVVLQINESPLAVVPKLYFNSNKSYLVLGGLGGFGLELCNWLVSKGVRNLALVSRSGVTNGYQALQISRWKTVGVKMIVIETAIETRACVQAIFQQMASLGPVGGIFNLAMVLRDGFFENQTVASFEEVIKPKVRITKILDTVSRDACPELEYFVGFSSVTSGRGNEGQTNYGMANSSLEQICENRRKSNFPALAIQWGAIGDVGVVHEKMGGNDVIVAGTVPQPLTSCFKVLEQFLFFQNDFQSGIVSNFIVSTNEHVSSNLHESNESSATSLQNGVLKILGMDEASISSRRDSSFGQLGMDSLMLVEMKQLLERHGQSSQTNAKIRQLTWNTLQASARRT